MKPMPTKRKTCIVQAGLMLLLVAGLGGCSTTKLTSVWVDETYSGKISRILVVGIDKEPHQRRVFEDVFVGSLAKAGLQSSASHRIEGLPEKPTAEDIESVLPGEDADGVLAVRLLGVESETVYHPPTVEMVPYRYYDRFTGYYRTVYNQVHRPGYYSNHTVVSLESNLYDASTSNLLWSAKSRSVDPKSVDSVAQELADEVITGIHKAGFF